MAKADRIFLIGPMGAGKSTLGRQLARRLGLEFVDADHALEERTGVDIPRIFDIEGEAGFRRREAALIDELTRRPGIVLATGGGAILDPGSQEALTGRGVVVYLRTSLETQLERTRRSDRPMLRTPDRRQRLTELMDERGPIYERLADITLDSDDAPPGGLCQRLVEELQERDLVRP